LHVSELNTPTDAVNTILGKYEHDSSQLISVLQDMQAELGYLPKESLRRVAEHLDVPLAQVYHVATFYTAFSLTPRGRHLIRVCTGTACHVRGAAIILEEIERQLGVKAGEVTPDMRFTLETVNCVGACALGPAVVIDTDYYSMSLPDISTVLAEYE